MSTGVAIVGAAESDQIGVVPDKTAVQLHAEAATNARVMEFLGRATLTPRARREQPTGHARA